MKVLGSILCAVALVSVPLSARQAASGDTAAIAKVRTAYESAVNAHDWAALAKLHSTDGEEYPPNAPALKGRAAIEAFHKKMGADVELTNLKIHPTSTHASGDWGFDAGTYTQTVTPKGGKAMSDKGKYVVVLHRDAGAWTIAHVIYNSDNPPPGAK